jgi:YHS domain-containing protein
VAITPTPQATIEPPATSPRPSWPAETTLTSPTAVATRSTIEPAASGLGPSTQAPWLDASAHQATPQPTPQATQQPLAATPAAPPAAAASLPESASPEPPKASWQSRFIAAIQKPFGWGSQTADPPTVPPALPRGPLAAAVQPAPPAAPEAAPEADPHGSMPLGLEGYCPVTLVDRGTWTEGRAQWGARHRGRTYLFAGPEQQRTFLADPDRYSPALSGDDPVLALDRNSCTPGQRRYGVTYRARMYLFASPETRQAFTADPDRYAARIALAERVPSTAGDARLY